jgi:hypothetical protein
MDELLTVEDAARDLGVKVRTVMSLVQTHRLHPSTGQGMRAQFTCAEIERYKQVRTQNILLARPIPLYREPPMR